MHIGIVAFTYLYWSGGAERYAEETAQSLVALGHNVTIYAADFLVQKPAPRRSVFPCRVVGVPVLFGPNSHVLGRVWDKNHVEENFHRIAPAFLLADHVRGQGADVIYGQVSGGIVGLRARKYTKTPVVTVSYNVRWGHFETYKQWLTRKSDGFVCTNQLTMDHHTQLIAPEPLPLHLIHKGTIDMKRYHPTKRAQAYRQALGVQDHETMILTLQRMDGRKDMMPVLDAFLDITRRHPQVKVFVGGSGPNKAQYETYVQGQVGGERVRFLGFVPDADLPTLYASADIFVAATYGYVNLEAMASGTATIVLNHQPQCREFVNDGIGGLLVEDNKDALIGALERLNTDIPLRERLALNGREFVLDGFEQQQGTRELGAFFERVLAKSR